MKQTLYKKGCEPFEATSREQVEFHRNQGWVENPEDVDPTEAVVSAPAPYNVLKEAVSHKPVAGLMETSLHDDLKKEIEDLKQIVAARDETIKQMNEDFEETYSGLNATIERLKNDTGGAKPFMPPAPPAPPASKKK